MLNHLFLGGAPPPCGDNSLGHPSNIYLLDCNGDGGVDLSDGICKLNFLFLGGPAPANSAGGTDNCQRVVDCPDTDCYEGA